jgi:hypothetical protein
MFGIGLTQKGSSSRTNNYGDLGYRSCETIYQILRSEKQDPYAYWRSFYMGMLAGGVSTEPWDRDMAFLRAKHVGTNRTSQAISRQPGEAFSDGFHGFNVLFERFMASMADGTLDARETDDLLDILGIVRPQVEQLHTSLIAHKAKLDKDDYNGSQQSVAGSRQKA